MTVMPLADGLSVNPFPKRGADYAYRITAHPPGFDNLTASMKSKIEHVWLNKFLSHLKC